MRVRIDSNVEGTKGSFTFDPRYPAFKIYPYPNRLGLCLGIGLNETGTIWLKKTKAMNKTPLYYLNLLYRYVHGIEVVEEWVVPAIEI